MKTIVAPLLLYFFFLSHAHAQLAARMEFPTADRSFLLGRSSQLKIEGKTNVNGFSCGCAEQFASQAFSIGEKDADGLSTNFSRTKLKIKVKNLDCGNKLMNKDLQQSMNADKHPYITIELLKVTEDKCNRLAKRNDWVKVKALARITLNDHSNDYWLDITAKKSAENHYRFIGSKALRMTDFGVTPPVALMGMVKVQDGISIQFDLDVSVQ